jgi:hypothetical protein
MDIVGTKGRKRSEVSREEGVRPGLSAASGMFCRNLHSGRCCF